MRRVQVAQQLGDGALEQGVDDLWRDLGQRLEDEAALMHQGMRQGQAGRGEDLVAVEEQVEIDWAGPPFFAADAADLPFDLQQALEQSGRRKRGRNFHRAIEKRR